MKTEFAGATCLVRGKVRDIYEAEQELLIVATDRISAFDVVMDDPIPGKGIILTRISRFWFEKTADIVKNHAISFSVDDFPARFHPFRDTLNGRSMLVTRAEPLPVECVVRGYLGGSGWKDYQEKGVVSGVALPAGLVKSARLSEPIFTPSTKAERGQHDLPISRQKMEDLVGVAMTKRVVDISMDIYLRAQEIAGRAGIIIADTKMEFGLVDGELILIDELLTPDSSRFWPKDEYAEGRSQRSFDKQFLRDYLLSLEWNKTPPPPRLPDDIIIKTRERYEEALQKLTDYVRDISST